jgi:hypothetical protein
VAELGWLGCAEDEDNKEDDGVADGNAAGDDSDTWCAAFSSIGCNCFKMAGTC